MVKKGTGRVTQRNRHLNAAEAELMALTPGVSRIDTHVKPCVMTITLQKNHNPDFRIFYPEQGKGIFVELKGHIQDRDYLRMLKVFPPALKKIYKVSLWERSQVERNKVKRRLDEYGIEWYDDGVNPDWLVQASRLYTGLDKMEPDELEQLRTCLNYFPDRTN